MKRVTQPVLLVHIIRHNNTHHHANNWLLSDFWAQVATKSRQLLAFTLSNTLELIFVSPAQPQAD
jgi:hypothetical protein